MARTTKTPELAAEAIRLRKSGLTLAKVAKTIGVSSAAVYDWTRNHFPKREPKEANSEYAATLPWGDISSHLSDSHNYAGHDDRIAGHTARIREYLRAHPEETFTVYGGLKMRRPIIDPNGTRHPSVNKAAKAFGLSAREVRRRCERADTWRYAD